MHVDMALAAINAGKHVYSEKPLSVTAEEAQRMTDAALKSGVKTMVAFNNIKTPAALFAKQIIERGEIGRLLRFRGTFDQGFFNDPNLPWSWRCSRQQAGSGAFGGLGAHTVSVAQFLMGDIIRVSAQSQTFFTERPVPKLDSGYASSVEEGAEMRAVENDDQIQCLVSFENGAAGVIEASRIATQIGSGCAVIWLKA